MALSRLQLKQKLREAHRAIENYREELNIGNSLIADLKTSLNSSIEFVDLKSRKIDTLQNELNDLRKYVKNHSMVYEREELIELRKPKMNLEERLKEIKSMLDNGELYMTRENLKRFEKIITADHDE